MRIAISGAGIGGPTLAYWLLEGGHEVVLIESAPHLRTGGYIVDFWGVGYDIADRMGLIPEIQRRGYTLREVRFVDDRGRTRGGFDAAVFARLTKGRFTSVLRADLSAVIYAAIRERAEVLFDESITRIEDGDGGARVSFARAPARDFDFVIGADGLHSNVRGLVWPYARGQDVSLGYHVAAFATSGYRPRDERVYLSHAVPGRQVSRFSMRNDATLVLFVFRDEYLDGTAPADEPARKAALAHVFANVGWECPALLDAMQRSDELYFDRVSQMHLSDWSRGRVALIGDAASCVSLLAGEGAGLAMLQAYVLAWEMAQHPQDHRDAFARYEARLRPFVTRKQRSAARFASTFAPRTRAGIFIRNAATKVLRIPMLADWLLGQDIRDDITLPR